MPLWKNKNKHLEDVEHSAGTTSVEDVHNDGLVLGGERGRRGLNVLGELLDALVLSVVLEGALGDHVIGLDEHQLDPLLVNQLGGQGGGDGVALVLHGEVLANAVTTNVKHLLGEAFLDQGEQLLEEGIIGLHVSQGVGHGISHLGDGHGDLLGEVGKSSRVVVVLSEEQLTLESGQLAELHQDVLDDLGLVVHELLLGEEHGAGHLAGGSDHTALVGRGVLDDGHLALLEQAGSGLRGDEDVGALDDQLGGRLLLLVEEGAPVVSVHGVGATTSGHKSITLHAVVHGVASVDALLVVGHHHEALLGQLGGVEVSDGKGLLHQSQQLLLVQALGVLSNTEAIGHTDNLAVGAVVSEQDADQVARDVSVRAAGHLHGEAVLVGVDAQGAAQGHVQVHHDTLGGHTIHLVVDAVVLLGGHEGIGDGVASHGGALDDPVDIIRDHLLIGAEVDQLVLLVEVHQLGHAVLHDEVKHGVGESLDGLAHGERAGALLDGGGVHQDDTLGTSLGNVLVLQLLGQREAVHLVELAGALLSVLVTVTGGHDTQTTTGNVAEAVVETVEVAAVHEEETERQRSLGGGADGAGGHDDGVHSQTERIAVSVEEVGAQGALHRLEDLAEHQDGLVLLQHGDLGLDGGAAILVSLVGQSRGQLGVEALQEQLGDGVRNADVVLVRVDQLDDGLDTGELLGIGLVERAVKHGAEGGDHLGLVQAQLGVSVEAQVGGLVVEPLGALQVRREGLRELRVGVQVQLRLKCKDKYCD